MSCWGMNTPSVLSNLLAGQYRNPIRIVAFNTAEGWSRDVTEDIARAVLMVAEASGEPLAQATAAFVQRAIGNELPDWVITR